MKKKLFLSAALIPLLLVGCNSNSTEDNPQEHVCNHVCDVCGGCLDETCTDSVCENKCSCEKLPEGANIYEAFEDIKVSNQIVHDDILDIDVEVTTFNKFAADATNLPAAVYVINHKNERAGTMSDIYCVFQLLKEYVVVVVDYKNNDKAVSPRLEESAHKFNANVSLGSYTEGIDINLSKTYLVPSGNLIKRDIVYYDLMRMAPKGFQEKTVSIWNTTAVQEAVEKAGGTYKTVTKFEEIPMKNGDSITKQNEDGRYPYLEYKLDIVYPTNPDHEIPVVLNASSSDDRNKSRLRATNLERYQLSGFSLNGYATAIYDHEYYPFMPSEYGWGHIEPNYTLQNLLGNRSHTAAVRCVKYYADELGYSKNLYGVYGHSKSSWCSLLSDRDITSIDPDDLTEVGVYTGYQQRDCYGEQPYQTYKDGSPINANITCIYHSMGAGTSRAKKYVKEDLVPTMIGCGEKCEYNSWSKFYETTGDACVLMYFEAANPNFIDLPMYGVNHTYPYNRDDILYDYNYYYAFHNFFDYYLKNAKPELFYTSAGLQHKITSLKEIFLQFNGQIDGETLNGNAKVISPGGAEVDGTWTSKRQGNRWVFTPTTPLVDGEVYRITGNTNIKDLRGVALKEAFEDTFTYEYIHEAGDDELTKIQGSVLGDVTVTTDGGYQSTKYGSSDVLRIYRSNDGATSRFAYLKYNIASLLNDPSFETISTNPDAKVNLKFTVSVGGLTIDNSTLFTAKMLPAGSDFDESVMCWTEVKSTGQYYSISHGKGTAIQNSFKYVDGETAGIGTITISMSLADVLPFITKTTGDLFGNLVMTLWSNNNTIRFASKENTKYPTPEMFVSYPTAE